VLLSPVDGVHIASGTAITLTWMPAANAASYLVELWGPQGVSRPAARITAPHWSVGVLPDGGYWWLAEAYNQDGQWSGWSEYSAFTIAAPVPTPETPTPEEFTQSIFLPVTLR
jgi:hypothetical protein